MKPAQYAVFNVHHHNVATVFRLYTGWFKKIGRHTKCNLDTTVWNFYT